VLTRAIGSPSTRAHSSSATTSMTPPSFHTTARPSPCQGPEPVHASAVHRRVGVAAPRNSALIGRSAQRGHVRTSRIVKVGGRHTLDRGRGRRAQAPDIWRWHRTEPPCWGQRSLRSSNFSPAPGRRRGKSRVEPEATAPALTALLAGRSLGAARASGDADGAPQC
jgi:hypothetical protein